MSVDKHRGQAQVAITIGDWIIILDQEIRKCEMRYMNRKWEWERMFLTGHKGRCWKCGWKRSRKRRCSREDGIDDGFDNGGGLGDI